MVLDYHRSLWSLRLVARDVVTIVTDSISIRRHSPASVRPFPITRALVHLVLAGRPLIAILKVMAAFQFLWHCQGNRLLVNGLIRVTGIVSFFFFLANSFCTALVRSKETFHVKRHFRIDARQLNCLRSKF